MFSKVPSISKIISKSLFNPTQLLFSLLILLDNNTGLKYLSGGVQNLLVDFKATEQKKIDLKFTLSCLRVSLQKQIN